MLRPLYSRTPSLSGFPPTLVVVVPFDGVQLSSGEMQYDDYETVGTWRVERSEFGDSLRLTLIEPRARADISLPATTWDRSEFPAIHEDSEGQPQAIAYGTVLRCPAVCVDTSTNEFRVVGHAITSFLAHYAAGVAIAVTAEDLPTAGFIYGAWDGTEKVTVDIVGHPETNPADVVEHLLTTYAGEPAEGIDSAALAIARDRWEIGQDRNGIDVHKPALSVYIDGQTVSEILSGIALDAFAVIYTGRDGTYQVIAWSPVAGEGLPILSSERIGDLVIDVDATEPITRTVGKFSRRIAELAGQVSEVSSTEYRLRRDLREHWTLERDVLFSIQGDADTWGSRVVRQRGVPLTTFQVQTNVVAATLNPGDFVRVTYSPRDFDEIVEVYEIDHDPTTGDVFLVCGDARGMKNTAGFLAAGSPVFPDRLGGGSAETWSNGWTDAQKRWASENIGYWTDDDGYASPGNSDSQNINVWS